MKRTLGVMLVLVALAAAAAAAGCGGVEARDRAASSPANAVAPASAEPAARAVPAEIPLALEDFGPRGEGWRSSMTSATVHGDHLIVLIAREISSEDVDEMTAVAKELKAKRGLAVVQLDVMYAKSGYLQAYRLLP